MTRILVLDDNADLRGAVQTALELEKYDVITGRSGREGLKILENDPAGFAAVICDVRMPDGDGLALLRQVRANSRWHEMLFIVTSGSKDDESAALKGGADDFLLKPFGMYDLIKRLKELLENP
jgi:two-component system OmpR family response regulator